MNAFLAVLKDSYREARDGWVVNAMLVLLAILMLITLSLSYEPAPANDALNAIVRRFTIVFPEKGQGKVPVETKSSLYSVDKVETLGSGKYRFELKVNGDPEGKIRNEVPVVNVLFKPEDGFRASIVNWRKPPGGERAARMSESGMGFLEYAKAQPSTPEELDAVTDDEMAEFIKHQFVVNGGIDDVSVKRISTVKEQPNYRFEIEIDSGSGVRGWPHTTKIFFGAATITKETPLGFMLWLIEEKVINTLGAGLVLLISVVITAFFIPNMLRKGSLDLLITKPISRNRLLIYKYVGGLIFIGLLSLFSIGGIWLVIGMRSGYWDPKFLLLAPILTFTFAILYSVSTLFGVLTRSGIVAILVTIAFVALIYIVGHLNTQREANLADPRTAEEWPAWVNTTVSTLHTILPRYKDIDRITTKLISDGTLTPIEKYVLTKQKAGYPDITETLLVSSAFIVLMLGLACWRFSTRDG